MPQPEPVFLVGAWVPLAECAMGSRYKPCQDCGAEVVIAPAGQELLRQGALLICVRCYRRREGPRPIVTAATREEMSHYLGRPVAEEELETWIDQVLGE